MPFSATFTANFDNWQKALDDAKATTRTFGKDVELASKGVQAQLQRMTSSFDGTKVIKDATLAVAAIEKIGGVAKLTASEQQRLNTTVTEALAKYHALGQQAPAALQKLAQETQQASTATTTMTQRVTEYAAGLAVFALGKQLVAGVFGAFKDGLASTLALGDSLSNMAAKTGMSVEGLQRLKFAGVGASVSIETLADAAAIMGVRLENADKGAVGALTRLGISLASFQTLDTDTQLLTINRALLTVGSTAERNALQAELFGKAWKSVAPAMASDLTELGQRAEALGIVLDTQTVAAIDKMGDALDAMRVAGEGVTARFMLPFIATADRLATAVGGLQMNLGDLAEIIGTVAVRGGNLWNPFDVLNAVAAAGGAKAQRAQGAWEDLGAAMTKAMHSTTTATTTTVALTDAQRKAIAAAEAHTKALAGVTGLDKVQAARALVTLIEELGGTGKIAASQFESVNKTLTAGIVIGTELGLELPSAMVRFARETQAANDKLVDMAVYLKSLPTLVQQIPVPMPADVPQGFNAGVPSWAATPIAGGAFVPAPNQAFLDAAAHEWQQFTKNFSTSLADWIVGLKTWKDALKTIWSDALTMMRDVVADGLDSVLKGVMQQLYTAIGPRGLVAIGSAVGAFAAGKQGGAGAGMAAGAALGAQIGGTTPLGPIGALIGAAVGAAVGYIGSKFKESEQAKQNTAATAGIQAAQGDLTRQFGTVNQIGGMNSAGQALAAAWGSQGVQGAEEFDRLSVAFQQMTALQKTALADQIKLTGDLLAQETDRAAKIASLIPSWDTVNGLMTKYGISLAGSGQTLTQMATDEGVMALVNNMETLERAGIDVGGMLAGMSDEISAAVNQSKAMGTELAGNLQPYVESLFAAGKLVDDHGEALTSLAGIKWGAALETEEQQTNRAIEALTVSIGSLKEALEKIATFLTSILPAAAQAGAKAVENAINNARPVFKVGWDVDEAPTPDGFASGTGGLRSFDPRGELAVLHGREAVLTEAQYTALQAAARRGARRDGLVAGAPQGGGTVSQQIVVMLDRDVLMTASARGLPGYLELLGA